MKRLIIAAAVAGVLGGCNLKNSQKVEAYKRWHRARARMVYSVGSERLKVGDLDRARSSATQALVLDPDCVPARVLLGKVLLEEGKYAEAVEELRRAQRLLPESPEIAYVLGVALEKAGRGAEALRSYKKALVLDPSNDACVTASAEVLAAMGKPKEALTMLEARLERSDDNSSMLVLAGELAMLLGQPARAADFYQRCLDMNPASLLTRENLAKAHFFAGHYAEALGMLKKLSERPEYRKSAWVYVMTGETHMALKEPKLACAAYEAALEIEHEAAPVWVRLAKAAMVAGDEAGAVRAARQALVLSQQSLEATVVLGYALLRQGKAAEATALLAAAANRHPDDATLRCMLGRCYAVQGQSDRALACYRRALKSDPKHQLASSLLAASGGTPNKPR